MLHIFHKFLNCPLDWRFLPVKSRECRLLKSFWTVPPTIREICRFLSQLPFKHFTPAAARSKRISCIFSQKCKYSFSSARTLPPAPRKAAKFRHGPIIIPPTALYNHNARTGFASLFSVFSQQACRRTSGTSCQPAYPMRQNRIPDNGRTRRKCGFSLFSAQ